MKYGEALKLVGGLSKPSKMPWWSWSISASECITGGRLQVVEGSTCSMCYALKGNYVFRNVKEAHARRLEASQHPNFVDAFVVVLTNLHNLTRQKRGELRENRFRWFDSGDLQSVEMLESINQIALRTPQIDHWLPTREFAFVRDFLTKHGHFAPNLFVRLSVPMVGAKLSQQPHGLPYSTVGCDEMPWTCPALKQGNVCGACDRCWSRENINYPLH